MLKSKITLRLIILSLLLTIFFYFPDFYALQVAPEEALYSRHASWFDPWDINVYISAIKWSQHSPDFFQNAYTTSPHKSAVIYPFYTLLGRFLPTIDAAIVFTTSKIVLGFFLTLIIYLLSLIFLNDKRKSLLATFLICLGGGLGWVFYKFFYLPDLVVTPFTFSATFQRPHEMLAVIFYLASLGFLYKAVSEDSKTKIITSAVLSNFVTIFYPPYLLTYILISGAFLLNQYNGNLKKAFYYFFLISLYSLPFGLLYTIYLINSQGFENVVSPNLTSPNLVSLSLGYGILAPIFLYQLLMESKDKSLIFLNYWFLISLAAAYLPVSFSRYYLRGLFFPLVLINIHLLPKIGKSLKIKKSLVTAIFTLLLIPTSLFIFWKRMAPDQIAQEWYYLTGAQKSAVEFLNNKNFVGQGVIALYPIANWLPAHTNTRVYYGHHNQTPNSKSKLENQNKFYSGEFEESVARNFLEENYIDFVWCEIGECSLNYNFLLPVYENEEVIIFSY